MNVAKKVQGVPRATVLNGQPATVFVEDGAVVAALVLDIMDGVIVGVRAVTNPDKLARLSARLPGAAPKTWRWRRRPLRAERLELPPPDLARRRAGEVVDEDELLRGRPGGDAVGDDLSELVERGRVVGGHHPGHHPLAPFGVGPLPDRHLGHAGVGDEDALDQVGPDLLGPGGDDVVDAAGHDELPVGVEPAGVAGGEPVRAAVGPVDAPVVPSR